MDPSESPVLESPDSMFVSTMLAERAALEQALATGEIVPHYQPIIDLRSGSPRALEILARWQHPQRGALGPEAFLPLAEAAGWSGVVRERVLARAVRETQNLVVPGGAAMDLHLNLSDTELRDPGLARSIRRVLAGARFAPERMVLEISEASFERGEFTDVLRSLRTLGVRLALDDFGLGRSSFSSLATAGLSAIKIDRSLLGGIVGDRHESVLRAVVGVARTLGIRPIAVGVEDAAQRTALLEAGCEQGQGFLFSRAAPVEVLERYLAMIAAPKEVVPRRWRVGL